MFSPFGERAWGQVREHSSCGTHRVSILSNTVHMNCQCATVIALVGSPLGPLSLLRFLLLSTMFVLVTHLHLVVPMDVFPRVLNPWQV